MKTCRDLVTKARSTSRRSLWNEFRRRWIRTLAPADYDREDGVCRLPPDWLVLTINNVCNLKCKMCDVGLGDPTTVFWANLIGDRPQNMSLAMLEELLLQSERFKVRPKIGLAATEPLIHPEILAFCEAIVRKGFYCQITTNGSTLPRLASSLVDIGVDELIISCDGPRAIHDQVRGKKGSFDRLCQGVEMLGRAKESRGRLRPIVNFSFTVTDTNYNHLVETVKTLGAMRPERILISQLNFITREMATLHNSRHQDDLAVTRSNLGSMEPGTFDIRAIWEQLNALRSYLATVDTYYPPVHLTPESNSQADLERYYHQPQNLIGGRCCTDPWRAMMVKTDGSVIPSHGRCYNFRVGSITETDLPTIWNSDRFLQFRRLLKADGGSLPACSRCCGLTSRSTSERRTRGVGRLPQDSDSKRAGSLQHEQL